MVMMVMFILTLNLSRAIVVDIGPHHLLEVFFHCRAARGRGDLGRNHLLRRVAACLKISRCTNTLFLRLPTFRRKKVNQKKILAVTANDISLDFLEVDMLSKMKEILK